ncbi:MAG: Ferredoxin, 2Fe-2S [uncultured Craurococcus sp.]|uniref:Ferredoxin, 2Fe-2S n=1 Tax=uncultured Craurococcus sp. TaxID=1135998 RepID=A0A6J4JTP0_9PROT|nr:MAG: Ferredoxin, 2Fe-2S [uncultured Craurococcus sp.]
MPTITFVQPDGTATPVEAVEGESLMQAAINACIDGIVAECGGNCMCATCHVYVDAAGLPAMAEGEDALLDGAAAERRPNSRLACQIPVTPALDGITVDLPDRQL